MPGYHPPMSTDALVQAQNCPPLPAPPEGAVEQFPGLWIIEIEES